MDPPATTSASDVTAAPGVAAERRNHIFAVIAATILLLGVGRALLVVAHSPALGYMSAGGTPPSRAIGALVLALIVAIAAITAAALRRHPVASLVHALLFFLLVADPVATLWLSSAQSESYALVGAYGAATMVPVIALGRSGRLHWAVLMAAFFAIGMGPRTFMLLPLALVGVAWPMLIRRVRREAWWLLIAAVVVAVIAIFLPIRLAEPRDALGPTVMPAPAASDARAIEPLRSLRAIARTLPASATLAPAGLDVSAGASMRHVADLPPQIMSFAGLLASFPVTAWMMIAMTMILTAPFAVLAVSWSARREQSEMAAVPALYATLTAMAAYAVIAAGLGGGGDTARAEWLGSLAILAALIVLPLLAWTVARDAWAGPIALVVGFGIVLLAAGWLVWSREQPIAIGALERIDAGANKSLEVGGWALDPRGVRRVFATVGGGPETEATRGVERLDLQAHYPGYPDAVSGGFQMTIASNAWRADQILRVYVENRTGAVTEIDRRIVRVK